MDERRPMTPIALGLALAAALSAPAMAVAGSVSLHMETQTLDLASGQVLDQDPLAIAAPSDEARGDVKLAYNAARSPHAVVMPAAPGVELAFMDETDFDAVTAENAQALDFAALADEPLEPSDTVVVRTADGALYKLGNAQEQGTAVTFDYAGL